MVGKRRYSVHVPAKRGSWLAIIHDRKISFIQTKINIYNAVAFKEYTRTHTNLYNEQYKDAYDGSNSQAHSGHAVDQPESVDWQVGPSVEKFLQNG